VTATGSRLSKRTTTEKFELHAVKQVIDNLLVGKIILVIDDFHYIKDDYRSTLMRNIKGAVFNGLKVILLSVIHRAFDVIKAEPELTGRFSSVILPTWSSNDLIRIRSLGFDALNVNVNKSILYTVARDAQDNPFLMQRFCWELCFDNDIEKNGFFLKTIDNYDVNKMLEAIAKDAGLPAYQKLVTGPQSRKTRNRRPLTNGTDADIYEAVLLALAETGPKLKVSYDDCEIQ
jgi:hypothetical protein